MSTAMPAAGPAGVAFGRNGWPRVALLSLADKQGAVEFARALAGGGTRLLASGGTAAAMIAGGLDVITVEAWTGSGEMLGGRVKTLHPDIHAAILARRDAPDDMATLAARGLGPIDLVAVTLYPFETRGRSLDDTGMIEDIDIGGVALLRAAAKNHDGVIVLHDAAQYEGVLESLRRGITHAERRALALMAFTRTARYDAAIASELARRAEPAAPPAVSGALWERARTLRYGENPHQPAALYARAGAREALESWREGKELSYNNLLDLEAAVALVGRFDRPACVIVKHTQPCGVACGDTLAEAYAAALAGDSLSAFGGIVALNRPLDAETAAALAGQFVECVAFPAIEPGADAALRGRKNLRLVPLTADDLRTDDAWRFRPVGRWALLQGEGSAPPAWRTVTRREPTDAECAALRFAWDVCAASRSNAIVLARREATIGIGSGQTSRVDAVEVALLKAARAGHDVRGAVLASDGFFPFPDGVEKAAAAGVVAIAQPGGSVKDADVIAAADAAGLAMCFTDRREFRH